MEKIKEIEKKYLLMENNEIFASEEFFKIYGSVEALKEDMLYLGREIDQGYLAIEQGCLLAKSLRWDVDFEVDVARLRKDEDRFYLTLKSKGAVERDELEDEITKELFEKNWPLTKGRRIRKFRLEKKHGNYIIEFDIFDDVYSNKLILAEVEVESSEDLAKVPVLGKDVSKNLRYTNVHLAK